MAAFKAGRKGIKLEVGGELSFDEKMVYDLCIIVTNAINNAIEACTKCGEVVRMNAFGQNGAGMIIIENPGREEMLKNISAMKTSKEEKESHGFGLSNIYDAVSRIGGKCGYSYENGKILSEVKWT